MSPFLRDEDLDVRLAAAIALRRNPDSEGLSSLLAAVGDPSPAVRTHVVQALAKLSSVEASQALIQCLDDGDWGVRAAAARALGERQERLASASLTKLLDDEDGLMRVIAARSLVAIGDRNAVDAVQAAAMTESNGRYRKALNRAAAQLASTGREL